MKASQLSCRAWIAWDCHRSDSPPVGTRDSATSRTFCQREWKIELTSVAGRRENEEGQGKEAAVYIRGGKRVV